MKPERLRESSEMNVTPFIDVLVDTQPRSVRSVIDDTIMIEYTADLPFA